MRRKGKVGGWRRQSGRSATPGSGFPRRGSRCMHSKCLKADGIADPDGVIWNRDGKAEATVKVELLARRYLVGGAEVDLMLRAATLGERTGIFDIGVPGLSQLA